jgi:hypothetical protein
MARFIELHRVAWKSGYAYEKGNANLINVDHIACIGPYKEADHPDINGVKIHFTNSDCVFFIESYEMVKEMINE